MVSFVFLLSNRLMVSSRDLLHPLRKLLAGWRDTIPPSRDVCRMTISANLQELIVNIVIRIAVAALVLLIGWWLARKSRRWAKLAAERAGCDLLPAQCGHLCGVLRRPRAHRPAGLSVLGIPLTSMAAISGPVVVTVGIALKETLADLAAAIIFYTFQPFKVGDTIETSGVIGKVVEIQLFFTVFHLANNRVVTLPNRAIQSNGITNYSTSDVLRADVPVASAIAMTWRRPGASCKTCCWRMSASSSSLPLRWLCRS